MFLCCKVILQLVAFLRATWSFTYNQLLPKSFSLIFAFPKYSNNQYGTKYLFVFTSKAKLHPGANEQLSKFGKRLPPLGLRVCSVRTLHLHFQAYTRNVTKCSVRPVASRPCPHVVFTSHSTTQQKVRNLYTTIWSASMKRQGWPARRASAAALQKATWR